MSTSENIIIKSKKDSKLCKKFLILSLVLLVASVIYLAWACDTNIRGERSLTGYRVYSFFDVAPVAAASATIVLLGGTIGCLLTYFAIKGSEIVVEKDNVYSRAMFGTRVDLPVDSISAIGVAPLKSISVSTSSGAIRFCAIENVHEVKNVITALVKERQRKPQSPQPEASALKEHSSNADELKKYKELLDSGVITQEEFDAKKKQLLDL